MSRPLTSVLERVYAPAPSTEAWLAGIQEVLSEAFEGHAGAQAYTARVTDTSTEVEAIVAHDPALEDMLVENHRHADAPVIAILRKRPVIRASTAVDGPHPARDFAVRHGIEDVMVAVGFADAGHLCAASLLMPADEEVSRGVRTNLGRLAAHLAAGYRLRRTAEADDDAVLTPEGALLHASRDAEPARERLRTSARAILDAKRANRADPNAGLEFWCAMVDGRWTLVERIDTDGKRLLVARKNTPGTREIAALTERERTVLERASLGRTMRYIAYELGLAESTASETLSRALKKLGIANRAELVELRAAIVGSVA